MTENPYAAPKSVPSAATTDADLADALAPLVASRPYLVTMAVLSALAALIGIAPILAFVFFSGRPSVLFLGAAVPAAVNVAIAVMLARTSSAVGLLRSEATFAKLTYVLGVMGQMWMVAAVAALSPLASAIVFSISSMVGSVAALGFYTESSLLGAAHHLRSMMRLFLVVGALPVAARVFSLLYTVRTYDSLDGSIFMHMGLSNVAIVLFSGTVGWVVWRQLPLLGAFIARPESATLAAWAAAQRTLWQTCTFGLVMFIIFQMLAAGTMIGLWSI